MSIVQLLTTSETHMHAARLLTPILTAIFLLGAGSVPAYATSGTTSSDNGVLFPGCEYHEYTYSIDLPAEATDWSMDVIVRSADGLEATSDYVYDVPTSGTAEFLLCGSDMAGTYTITGEVEWYDENYDSETFDLTPSTFEMRKPLTRTTLTSSKTAADKGDMVRFRVMSLVERPNGYFANDYESVVLQVAKRGAAEWTTLSGSKTYTNDLGKAAIKMRMPGRRAQVRAMTVRSADFSESISPSIVIR